jgi:hypothetical protein
MSYLRDSCCSICVERLDKVKKNDIRQVTEESLALYRRFWANFHLEIGDKICGKCRSKYNNYLKNQNKLVKKNQSHDNSSHDNSSHDNSSHDNSSHDNSSHDNSSHDNSSHDNSSHHNSSHDNSSHDNHLVEITTNQEKNKGNFYNESNIERKNSSKIVEDDLITVHIP